jgi:F-type H+-transporting ATPase subunit b
MLARVVSWLLIGGVLAVCGPPALGAANPPEAEGAAGVINPLAPEEIKGDLAVWTAAVFVVLLLVLWKFAWGPLAQGLERRERAIAEQIAQAERAHQQAQELLAQYEQRLAQARDEVRAILDQGRRDAEQVGRDLIEKARSDAAAEQQHALRQIDAATAAALKELADRSAGLAVELAGKILRIELKPSDHADLIRQAVASFAAQPPSMN